MDLRKLTVQWWMMCVIIMALTSSAGAQSEPATATIGSEYYLPADTRGWISIPNLDELNRHIAATQMGQLTRDPALKPFFDSARARLDKWMEARAVKIDFRLDDFENVETGEICIAGVLPQSPSGKMDLGTHGIVLMVDVTKDPQGVEKVLQQIETKLVQRKASKQSVEIHGVATTKWTYPEIRRWANRKRVSFQTISNGWLLVSDNETIFRSVLKRLVKLEDPKVVGNLASQESFQACMQRCEMEGAPADVRWFVEPFGYIKLARAIEVESQSVKELSDDWTTILANNGLKAIRALAGTVAVATEKREAMFRIFVHAPKDQLRDAAEKRMMDILDFGSIDVTKNKPPRWVPSSVSGVFSGQWKFSQMLEQIGPIVDSFINEEGGFKTMLATLREEPEFRVDIPKLVGQLEGRFTIVSETVSPLEADSEKLAVGLRLVKGMTKDQQREMLDSIRRAIRGKMIKLGSIDVVEDDRTSELEDDPEGLGGLGDFGDPLDGGGFEGEAEKAKFGGDDAPDATFALFERKYITIAKGHLFVCNDKRYLRKLLRRSRSTIAKQSDYQLFQSNIGEIVNVENVRWSRFGRLDKIFELNYEMIRRKELAASKSLLGKVANEILNSRAEDERGEPLKLEVDKLPEDYQSAVAKYLGTMGWVLENEQGGWRITGCILKK